MYVEMYPDKIKALCEERGKDTRTLAAETGLSADTTRKVLRGGRVQSTSARSIILALGEEPSVEWGRIVRD